MKTKDRRTFLKRFGQGALASITLPAFGATLRNDWKTDGISLGDTNSEAYWELVKSQFNMAEGLSYFNNASLGASSIKIQQETQNFRNLLDGTKKKKLYVKKWLIYFRLVMKK